MQIQKLKLGQQNSDIGSINLAGANKKATLKCKKIIIKTLAKLYESVYCHSSVFRCVPLFLGTWSLPFVASVGKGASSTILIAFGMALPRREPTTYMYHSQSRGSNHCSRPVKR